MNGLAITIIVGQLPKLCGFSTDADGFVDELAGLRRRLRPAQPDGAGGSGSRPSPSCSSFPASRPRSRPYSSPWSAPPWSPACLDLDIKPWGPSPQGLPAPALPWTDCGDIAPMLVAAIGITLVSLTDTIATSTSFAARRGEEVDPNQEMIGIGTANIAAGFFQGFAVSTSGSRTAVAEQSGAKSQLTGVIGAGVVALLLLFFNDAAREPAADGARRGGHRRGALAGRPARPSAVTRHARSLVPCSRWRDRRRRVLRRAAGHPHRGRAVDPAVLPAQLVAPRRGAGHEAGRRLARCRHRADGRTARRRAGLPVGGAAVLRQRGHVPPAGPSPGP